MKPYDVDRSDSDYEFSKYGWRGYDKPKRLKKLRRLGKKHGRAKARMMVIKYLKG